MNAPLRLPFGGSLATVPVVPAALRRPAGVRQAHALSLGHRPSGPHGAMPSGERGRLWQLLLDRAVDPDAAEVQALAGVLATAWDRHGLERLPLSGLDARATRRLLARWFPGVDDALGLDWRSAPPQPCIDARHDEIEELLGLLADHADPAAGSADERHWVALALSQGTLGQDHLWQDLHLPSRRELSMLIGRWFPQLAVRNDRDMKWKKFLYKQLCDRSGLQLCRAPSCSVCVDQALCFGPEDVAA